MSVEEIECPIRMNTIDPETEQQVICEAEDHAHCGGCYDVIPPRTVWCSPECLRMVMEYETEESGAY